MLVLRERHGRQAQHASSYSVAGAGEPRRARWTATPSCRCSSTRRRTRPATRSRSASARRSSAPGLITIEREKRLPLPVVQDHDHQLGAAHHAAGRISRATATSACSSCAIPPSDELFMSPLVVRRRAVRAPTSARGPQPVTMTAPKQVKPGEPLTMQLTPGEAVPRRGVRGRRRHPAGGAVPQPGSARLLLPEARARSGHAADPRSDPAGLQALPRALGARRRRRRPASRGISIRSIASARRRSRTGRASSTSARAGASLRYDGARLLQRHAAHRGDRASTARRMGVARRRHGSARATSSSRRTCRPMATPGDEFVVSVGVFNNTTGGTGGRSGSRRKAGARAADAQARPASISRLREKTEGVGRVPAARPTPQLGAAIRDLQRAPRRRAQRDVEEAVGVRPAAPYRTHAHARARRRRSAQRRRSRATLYSEHRTVEAAVSQLPLVWGQGLTAYLEQLRVHVHRAAREQGHRRR